MTHLDKLEAAIDHWSAIESDLRTHGGTNKYVMKVPADDGTDSDFLFQTLKEAAQKHLAAQRQGGDALPEDVMNLLMEYTRNSKADVERFLNAAQMCGFTFTKAHPPAVTVDRGALDALSSLVEDAKSAVDLEYTDHPALEHKRKRAFDSISECEQTIRAALLSAQGGVPGEVLERANTALKNIARHSETYIRESEHFISDTMFDMAGCMAEAHASLKVTDIIAAYDAADGLKPYLNTNDGRE